MKCFEDIVLKTLQEDTLVDPNRNNDYDDARSRAVDAISTYNGSVIESDPVCLCLSTGSWVRVRISGIGNTNAEHWKPGKK